MKKNIQTMFMVFFAVLVLLAGCTQARVARNTPPTTPIPEDTKVYDKRAERDVVYDTNLPNQNGVVTYDRDMIPEGITARVPGTTTAPRVTTETPRTTTAPRMTTKVPGTTMNNKASQQRLGSGNNYPMGYTVTPNGQKRLQTTQRD
jgi:hypothetical protein